MVIRINLEKYVCMNKLFLLLLFFLTFQTGFSQQPYQYLIDSEEYELVIQRGKENLSTHPTDSIAQYYIGYAFTKLGEYKKAINFLHLAKENGLQWYQIDLCLAKSYLALNKKDKAFNILLASANNGDMYYENLEEKEFASVQKNKTFQDIYHQMKRNVSPCKYDNKYRRFDFWIGEWNVFVNGKKRAESTISYTNGKCGILENYRPLNRDGGHSISYYNKISDKWEQNWVAWGNAHHYIEADSPYEGNLQMIANVVDKNGKEIMYRMTFTDLDNGNVRQEMEQSNDEGDNWFQIFDGL